MNAANVERGNRYVATILITEQLWHCSLVHFFLQTMVALKWITSHMSIKDGPLLKD